MKAEADPAMLPHRPMMHILVAMLAIGTKTQSLPLVNHTVDGHKMRFSQLAELAIYGC
jgi:hypothetical protein